YNSSEDMQKEYLRQKLKEIHIFEEYKNSLWELWLRRQEKEMIEDFEKERKACIKNIKEAFNNFLKYLEDKLMQCNPSMFKDHQSNLHDVCSNWSDDQCIEWFKTHGLDYIMSEFESWFNENISVYNKIMKSKLIKWNKKKKYAWELLPSKFYADRYWERWEKTGLREDPDHYIKVAAYPYWVKSREKENKMWNLLIERINKKYIDDAKIMVTQRYKETMADYNNWITSFYINWIENKLWKEWFKEKKMK
ncbi:tryptophan-rich antigen (Pv-fam-a), partial [Plasmodium malariae]